MITTTTARTYALPTSSGTVPYTVTVTHRPLTLLPQHITTIPSPRPPELGDNHERTAHQLLTHYMATITNNAPSAFDYTLTVSVTFPATGLDRATATTTRPVDFPHGPNDTDQEMELWGGVNLEPGIPA